MLRLLPILLALFASGCASNSPSDKANDYVKPTIAVMKFENRAPFPLSWDLGTGTRDVLVDRLVQTRRYHVIERPEIDSVLREIDFQHSGMTRPQEKARLGQIKNVQYLIKGTVTDFTHVSSSGGFLSTSSFGLFGGSNQAVMAITMYVVDVESGEIVVSETLQESVRASDMNVRAVYKDVAFGGSVFYKTPLGEATAKVIDKAVAQITDSIASRPWVPRIAHLNDDGTVILNGGADRNLNVGDEFEIVQPGKPIIDPDNGDTLAPGAAKVIGRLRITDVQPRHATATPTATTTLNIGQPCRKLPR